MSTSLVIVQHPTPVADAFAALTDEQQERYLATMSPSKRARFAETLHEEKMPRLRAEWKADPTKWASDRLGIYLWSKQVEVACSVRDNRQTVVRSAHGTGKAVAIDTPVLTHRGWVPMGEIVEGDQVRHPSGGWATVTHAWAPYEAATHLIRFSGGAEIVADAAHRWSTLSMSERRSARTKHGTVTDWRDHWSRASVRTTSELAATLRTRLNQANHVVPLTRPLSGEAQAPVDPYAFGYWLGNGTGSSSQVTAHSDDAGEVAGYCFASTPKKATDRNASTFYLPIRQYVKDRFRDGKYIPDEWLSVSVEDRMNLVRGLFDSDGSASKQGGAEIGFKDEALTQRLVEILRSLGVQANVTVKPVTRGFGKEYGPAYRTTFVGSWCPFRLQRKVDAWRPIDGPRATARTIESIEPTGRVETVRCITVDADDSLWLVGEHLIPTHNTHCAAVMACWWLDCHAPGTAAVSSTAPTFAQVRLILWAYIARMHAAARLSGRVLSTEWKMRMPEGHEAVVGFGRKAANTNPSGMQGIHSENMLVIGDEAGGLVAPIWDAFMSYVTGEGGRALMIGNPDQTGTRFHQASKLGSGWNAIKISAFDSPHFTGEEVPDVVLRNVVDKAYVESMKMLGERSAVYRSKVLGEFTDDDALSIVSSSAFARARQHEPIEDPEAYCREASERGEIVECGIDVGGGGDYSAITIVVGWTVVFQEKRLTPNRVERAQWVFEMIQRFNITVVKPDAIGIGDGLLTPLQMWQEEGLLPGVTVIPVNIGAAATDPKYVNLRADLFYSLGELLALDPSPLNLVGCLDECQADICEARKKNTATRSGVEPKSEIIKRLNRSPDLGDSLLSAYYRPQLNEGTVGSEPIQDNESDPAWRLLKGLRQ